MYCLDPDHAPYAALRALLGPVTDRIGIDDVAIGSPRMPLVLVATAGFVTTQQDQAVVARQLRSGGRVIVALSPHSAPSVAELFGFDAVLADATLPADEHDPLVLARRLVGYGDGVLHGLVAEVESPAPVGLGSSLLQAEDLALVTQLHLEGGVVVLVGSIAMLRDDGIAAADNAEVILRLVTGESASPTETPPVRDWQVTSTSHHHSPSVVAIDPNAIDISEHLGADLDIPLSDPRFISACGYAGRSLPATLFDALVDFQDDAPQSGALVIRGLPVGRLPATPSSPAEVPDKDRVSEFVLLAMARRLGQPVGYAPEHGGDLVQNILPTRASADRQVSTSSKVRLMWHTEAAFHPHRPRYLVLLCLRGDPGGEGATLLASVTEILQGLDLGTRRTLSEHRFATGVDESYTGRRATHQGRPHPVLSGSLEDPSFMFDEDLTHGLDKEATTALETLARTIDECHIEVTLQAGDLLVIDNHRAVHGRGPFEPRFDGSDRWLQRSFVVSDLSPSASDRHGRIVETRFLP